MRIDLGEQARVALLSVTEGADEPLKYPYIFRDASLVLVNKIDLLPHVEFDLEQFESDLRRVNPRSPWLAVSATTGEGMRTFYDFVDELGAACAAPGRVGSETPPWTATQA